MANQITIIYNYKKIDTSQLEFQWTCTDLTTVNYGKSCPGFVAPETNSGGPIFQFPLAQFGNKTFHKGSFQSMY